MRVTQYVKALSEVAEFMNVVRSGLTEAEWEKWCRSQKKGKWKSWIWERPYWLRLLEPGQPLKVSMQEAIAIRDELYQVLSMIELDQKNISETIKQELAQLQVPNDHPYTEMVHDLKRMHPSPINAIHVILNKLNESRIVVQWSIHNVDEDEGGFALQTDGERKHYLMQSSYDTEDVRARLYYAICEALTNGAISAFRICINSECRKYFAAKDKRQRFCDDSCRITLNNRLRAQEGYFQQNRIDRREMKLQIAKRLRDTGKSQEEVKAETKLPAREIRKLFAPRIFLRAQEQSQ